MSKWIFLGALVALGCDDGGGTEPDAGLVDAQAMSDVDVRPDQGGDRGVLPDQGADAARPPGCIELPDGNCVVETFENPAVLAPTDGVYRLELGPAEVMIAGKRHCTRGYNGLYPGPTIDVPALDGAPRQVRVDLVNTFTKPDFQDLEGRACTCEDLDTGMSCEPSGHSADSACHCHTDEGEQCHMFDFNQTNLHAHGSHVRPDYATGGGCSETDGLRCRACASDRDDGPAECFHADDVLSVVDPGDGVRHRWDIDEDHEHHAGLHWYHPHIHGTTAIQVASGAAGAWVVRGDIDAVPGIANARERIMVLTTPPVGANGFQELAEGEACTEDTLTFNHYPILVNRDAKQLNMVNHVHQPRMIMAPGQIERWRIVDASFLDEVFLVLAKGDDSDCTTWDREQLVPLTQYARDGIVMPRPADGDGWPFAPDIFFMGSGYRIEAILDGNQLEHGDTLCLVGVRFLQAQETELTNGPVGLLEQISQDELVESIAQGGLVAIVNVTEDAEPPTETTAPDYDAIAALAPSTLLADGAVDALERCEQVVNITDPNLIDQLTIFQVGFTLGEVGTADLCGCWDHNVNCRSFEETDRERYPYDRVLVKGEVEHWRVQAYFDGHPFHIHINPFLVCPLPPEGSDLPNEKSRLVEPPFAHWRDTYLLNLDRTMDAITEYAGHDGDFVFHCHKLTHEDHGMMQLIRICDPEVEDCDSTCAGGQCHWQHCAEDDRSCQREVAATKCIANPNEACREAAVRCARCTDVPCPPGSWCDDLPGRDGEIRCIPGCRDDGDCAPTELCDGGACALAPPCMPPCPPGRMCLHGACE